MDAIRHILLDVLNVAKNAIKFDLFVFLWGGMKLVF